ncbi:branched-chain amino acid aminotransferase [Pseudonocardia spinosispora]|uniref:branched-chain amino acid aminotransferase n=1 Tax=Pseudonocardia spinosispora TaxID=103441 RepID=UPI0006854BEB|nr:branched-chain amino acid aminotransferase [Pseudonocardia spinosispora]
MSTPSSPSFPVTPNPAPASEQRRVEILSDPGFGRYFTDHMVTIRWSVDEGWHDAKVQPYGPLSLDPAAMVFHYGQEIFEGLKAYRQPDGSIASFRAEVNAARFRTSATRMAMPGLPDELFLGSLSALMAVDEAWVPAAGGEESLYLRPFLISTEVGLGVRSAAEYLYLLIASPAGPYFSGGIKPVDVWLATEYTRASPGGTGAAKCGGNYAASLLPQQEATENGCAQVVYLDAGERRWIEEMGSNNIFFVYGSGADAELVTPELSGSVLHGVTRDSVLTLAGELGLRVTERKVSAQEWLDGAADGSITEVFGSGTAVVISPISGVKHSGGAVRVGDGGAGPITMQLRKLLTDIQRGTASDPHGWMHQLTPAQARV